MMYYKIVDGVKIYATDKIVLEDAVVFNPTKEQLIEAGFVEELPKEKTQDELLNDAIEQKVAEIELYDTSDDVNSFSFNGVSLWLDQATRISVMNSTNVRKSLGLLDTTLWLNGMKFTLPCDLVIGLLAQLENYALLAFDATEEHKANVRKLKSVEEVEKYDYKVGYPAKLELKTQ